MTAQRKARVLASEKLPAGFTRLTLEMGDGEGELGFVGGQYVIVNSGLSDGDGNVLKRAYSILSGDDEQKIFQLAVRPIPGGSVSHFLASKVVGEELSFSGPWGKFHKNPAWPGAGPVLVLATDTAITLAQGLLRSGKFSSRAQDCHALWLTEVSADPETLPVKLDVHLIPATDDPRRLGSAEKIIMRTIADMGVPAGAYLAGDGNILRWTRDFLVARGTPAEMIGVENFFHKVVS